jgi:hypothetical protein
MSLLSSIGFEGDGSDKGLHSFGPTRGCITVYQLSTNTSQIPAYEFNGWYGRGVGIARKDQVLWANRGNVATEARNNGGILKDWVILGSNPWWRVK